VEWERKSSINTDYLNDQNDWPEIIRQVENIARAGFTHVQWIHDWEGDYMYSRSEMYFVRDLLRGLGLICHTLHASEGGVRFIPDPKGPGYFQGRRRITKNVRKDYTSTREFIRLAGVDLIKNRIELSSLIGSGVIVLHMTLPFEMFDESPDDKKEYYRLVFKSLDEIESSARNAGVTIAVENLPGAPQRYADECFDLLFNRYGADYMGICFDSGHAALTCPGDYCHFLERYQGRLLALHLQDTDGLPEKMPETDAEILVHDRHWVPFSGVNDWDRIAKLIAGAPLVDLPADFEVVLSASSPEEEFRLLVDCRERAEKFHRMVLADKTEPPKGI
jgi:sugar phosphate isomerase/epimerase